MVILLGTALFVLTGVAALYALAGPDGLLALLAVGFMFGVPVGLFVLALMVFIAIVRGIARIWTSEAERVRDERERRRD